MGKNILLDDIYRYFDVSEENRPFVEPQAISAYRRHLDLISQGYEFLGQHFCFIEKEETIEKVRGLAKVLGMDSNLIEFAPNVQVSNNSICTTPHYHAYSKRVNEIPNEPKLISN